MATHPIQYYAPWYQAIANVFDLHVFYCHQQTPEAQGAAGFGVSFDWDVPLLEGYQWRFLTNRSRRPDVSTFFGCDTPEIVQIIHNEHFDAFIVHGWAIKSFWQAIIACRQNDIPVLVRGDSQLLLSQSRLWQLVKHPLYRMFIPQFDAYLVVGERAREYLLHYGARPERMFSCPHAVDNEFFSVSADLLRRHRNSLRQAWDIPEDAIVFLFAGKFIARKRPWDFARAIANASRVQPPIWGLMAGDGPLRANLEAETLTKCWPIRFAGFVNQSAMPRAYTASDALVLPSNGQETWGLVVNEAMASGLPTIVSGEVGCAPDLVHPGKTGEVFKGGSIDELTAILIQLAADPAGLSTLGTQARRHVYKYSFGQAVAGLEQAIETLVSPDTPTGTVRSYSVH